MTCQRHLALIGLMGSGKSTVGRRLAAEFGLRFIDNDEQLETMTGMGARDYEAQFGQFRLHVAELTALRIALAEKEPSVIAAAASVADRPSAFGRLSRRVHVIWLDAPPAVLASRIVDSGHDHRPRRTDEADLRRQHLLRSAALNAMADITVPADQPVEDIVEALRGWAQACMIGDGPSNAHNAAS